MSKAKKTDKADLRRRAEERLARSRPARQAAAAAHARVMTSLEPFPDRTILSFDRTEAVKIKSAITRNAPYASRISLAFAVDLFMIEQQLREADNVLREVDFLEGRSAVSNTQAASQFKYPPLAPFWHKHFWSSRHLIRNIGNRWGVRPQKTVKEHRELDEMIQVVTAVQGDNPEAWPEVLSYDFIIGAIQDRVAEKRVTGDWIIYARHNETNYYLALATHEEGEDAERLAEKIMQGSQSEFPFLFGAGAD